MKKTIAAVVAGMVGLAGAEPRPQDWKLIGGAVREGDIVTAVRTEGGPEFVAASLDFDFTPFDGQMIEAEIKARGAGVSRPKEAWFGFKFMGKYFHSSIKEWFYPGAAQEGGDFGWKTVTWRDTRVSGSRGRGTVTAGLQYGTGKVQFDLSTFKVRGIAPPTWPATNANHRCAYSARVKAMPPQRGVMLGLNLGEEDYRALAAWGAKIGRFQMQRQWLTVGGNRDLEDYGRYIDGQLDILEQHLEWARKYGLKIVVDLHAAPGSRIADGPCDLCMCYDRKYADAFIETWRKIARRFKGRAEIYGYDLVNEPMQTMPALPGCDYWQLQSRAAEAIREIDPETPVIVESNHTASPSCFTYMWPLKVTNVIYQAHMYVPVPFTHQGVVDKYKEVTRYPDPERGVDKETLRKALQPVRDFQLKYGARIYIGEFSAAAWAPGADAWLRDVIDIFREYGWDWSYHAFREWAGWSVEYVCPKRLEFHPSADNPRKRALLEGFGR